MINIFSPCTQEWFDANKDSEPILAVGKFVAYQCRNRHTWPRGYGLTAQEAYNDLVKKLHEEIEKEEAVMWDTNGRNPQHLDF